MFILRNLYGEDNQTPKHAANDLKQTTIIEVEDIANLLKALFKVNMYIAHREYFLKIDVPKPSNWWYGYQLGEFQGPGDILCDPTSGIVCDTATDDYIVCNDDGIKMISFEPCVELKFSNLHSDNQLDEEGNLICSVSYDMPMDWNITPVNRELKHSKTNKCIQYNDLYYFYDFNRSWKSTWMR